MPPLSVALQTLPPGFIVDGEDGPEFGRNVRHIRLSANHVFFGGIDDGALGPSGSQAHYTDRLDALESWMRTNELELRVWEGGSATISGSLDGRPRGFLLNVSHVWTSWLVGPSASSYSGTVWMRERPFRCIHCRRFHPRETVVCPESRRILVCTNCGARNARTSHFTRGESVTSHCADCAGRCQHRGCGEPCFTTAVNYCDEHAEHATCDGCNELIEWRGEENAPLRAFPRPGRVRMVGGRPRVTARRGVINFDIPQVRFDATQVQYLPPPVEVEVAAEEPTGYACEHCAGYICSACHTIAERALAWSDHHQAMVCSGCSNALRTQILEALDEEEMGDLEMMRGIPGRESIRLCGLEIEGGNGTHTGSHLARKYYTERLGLHRDMIGYHGERAGFVTVERDSSVDWEAVIGPLDPGSAADAEKLNRSVKIIREMVHAGELRFDMRAGLHIHVSAQAVGIPQAYNLSHLFTFLEDPLFRIGAAKWPFHRACQGNDGVRPIPKHKRKTDFFQHRGGNDGTHDDHYYALTFVHYFAAMLNHCRCGAVPNGFWDECTCPQLRKCTFEFRLFNTTANPRKILAYMALCQSLVAKAISMPEVKRPDEVLPGLPFNRMPLKGMTEEVRGPLMEAWLPRLGFILTELPLTEEERSAVEYCIRNSEIGVGLGDELLNHMFTNTKEVAA